MDLGQDGLLAVCLEAAVVAAVDGQAAVEVEVLADLEAAAAEVLADLVAAAVEVAAPAEDGKLNSVQLFYFLKVIFELVKTVTA